jgi:hypothetical protein
MKNDGFLKKLKEKKDKWTHIPCMKWFLNIKLSFENGFSIFRADKVLPVSIWTEECTYCKKTVKGDFFVKCCKQACNKHYHTKCILGSPDLKQLLEDIKTPDNKITYYLFHCDIHSIKITLSIENSKKQNKNNLDLKTYGKKFNVSALENGGTNIKY